MFLWSFTSFETASPLVPQAGEKNCQGTGSQGHQPGEIHMFLGRLGHGLKLFVYLDYIDDIDIF